MDDVEAAVPRTRSRPEPISIIVVCALVLTIIALVYVLLKLSQVLVPLVFAVFLAFLVEPILAVIVRAPQHAGRLCCQHGSCRGGLEATSASRTSKEGMAPEPNAAPADGASAEDEEHRTEVPELEGGRQTLVAARRPRRQSAAVQTILMWLQGVWDVISILLCVVVLLAILGGVVFGVYGAVSSFKLDSYATSPRVQQLAAYLDKVGIPLSQLQDGSILERFKGEVMTVALQVLNIAESVIITLLMFFFCLVATLPGIHAQHHRSRVKRLMQRYLLFKTISSLIVALAVMLALHILRVPLILLFGIITFILNFIPNVGSFFAILAPVPLVFLDPESSVEQVFLVVLVPFIIHNSLGCIIEPKLMADGLDLHPLTVVVALTFWGSLWGIAGAVLSVPITCAIRLALEEIDHPYARTLHSLFDGPLNSGLMKKRLEEEPPAAAAPLATATENCSPQHEAPGAEGDSCEDSTSSANRPRCCRRPAS